MLLSPAAGGFVPSPKAPGAVLGASSQPARRGRDTGQGHGAALGPVAVLWLVSAERVENRGDQNDVGQALTERRERGLGAASCQCPFLASPGVFLREIGRFQVRALQAVIAQAR